MQTRKIAFITLLAVLILSTSAFLILESSRYYTQFYESSFQPIGLAILLESFVIVLAMSKVYRLPLRIVQKGLMLLFFCIIVGTASLYHVNPIIQSISQSEKQEKIESIIQDEIDNLKNDQSIFNKQDQKLNSALSANRRHSVFKSLLSTVNRQNELSYELYINLIIILLIRFVLQTGNLFTASMLGAYYRTREIKSYLKNKVEVPKLCECGCGKVVSPGKRYILGHNLVPGKKKSVLKLRKNHKSYKKI